MLLCLSPSLVTLLSRFGLVCLQVDRSCIRTLCNCSYFIEYVDSVLLDERLSLNNTNIYQFFCNFFPKVLSLQAHILYTCIECFLCVMIMMQMNFFMKSNKNMYTFIPLESKKIVYNLCKSNFHNSHILANMAENGDIWKKYCAAHSDFFFSSNLFLICCGNHLLLKNHSAYPIQTCSNLAMMA